MARILVIDEDPMVLTVMHHVLMTIGHEVLLAKNVGEAMFLYMLWQPVDVMVADLFRLEMNDYALLSNTIRCGQEQEGDAEARIMALAFGHYVCNENVMLGVVGLQTHEVMANSCDIHAMCRRLKAIPLDGRTRSLVHMMGNG